MWFSLSTSADKTEESVEFSLGVVGARASGKGAGVFGAPDCWAEWSVKGSWIRGQRQHLHCSAFINLSFHSSP